MRVSAKETFAVCALTMLAGNVVDTACMQWAPPKAHFNFSELEGQYQYLTADGYWANAEDKEGANAGHRRKLRVRRPGRKSNEAKAAATLLLGIPSTDSFQMPAPVRTSVKSTTTKQVKRKAEDSKAEPQNARSPSPAYEPAATPADSLGRTGGSPGCPAGPPAPTTPSPTARASKRACRLPAAMADYIIG